MALPTAPGPSHAQGHRAGNEQHADALEPGRVVGFAGHDSGDPQRDDEDGKQDRQGLHGGSFFYARIMGREQFVLDTFVSLADTLASDYDVTDFLHELVVRCQEALGVDAGGVMLEDPETTLRLAAATSEKMERYEQAEITSGEGPCIDAYRNVTQVVAHDLREEADRWPNAAGEAMALGMQAVYAFPLRLRGDCIGALNLYREKAGPFHDDDVRLAQAFADVAAIGILQERRTAASEARAEQLQLALTSRIIIEQAKGVLIAKTGKSPQEAFEMLRSHARSSRKKLRDVAAAVVESQSAELR